MASNYRSDRRLGNNGKCEIASDTMGDPYTRTGADLDGRVGIDWGVYGVPETFVIDAEGRIAFKQIGPVTSEVLDQTILPLVRKLQQEGLRTP